MTQEPSPLKVTDNTKELNFSQNMQNSPNKIQQEHFQQKQKLENPQGNITKNVKGESFLTNATS